MAGVLLAGLAAAGLGTCWWLAHAPETEPRGGRPERRLLDFLTSREIA